MQSSESLESLIGKTFILTNNHPYSGTLGFGIRLENTPVGIGLLVELYDNCRTVYVFDYNQCKLT